MGLRAVYARTEPLGGVQHRGRAQHPRAHEQRCARPQGRQGHRGDLDRHRQLSVSPSVRPFVRLASRVASARPSAAGRAGSWRSGRGRGCSSRPSGGRSGARLKN